MEKLPGAVEGKPAKKQNMAEQNQQEEDGRRQRPFGPLHHAGGKPKTGQPRPFGKTGALEQLVQIGQNAGVQRVVRQDFGPEPDAQERQEHGHGDHGQDLKRAPVQEARQTQRHPGARHAGQDDEQPDGSDRHHVKMPGHPARQSVSRQQRRDQKKKGPGGEQGGFDEFPAEDGLGRNGQGGQELGFPVAEEIAVADDQVAEEQQHQQEGEEQVEQALDQQRAQGRKIVDELETPRKEQEGKDLVTHHEQPDRQRQESRGLMHGFQTPPGLEEIDARQQEERAFKVHYLKL